MTPSEALVREGAAGVAPFLLGAFWVLSVKCEV